jgi:hypothetical protein
MFGITQLWQAVAALAANVNALAQTVGEMNANLRGRLQLDQPDQLPPPPAAELDHQPAEPSGSAGRRRKRQSA